MFIIYLMYAQCNAVYVCENGSLGRGETKRKVVFYPLIPYKDDSFCVYFILQPVNFYWSQSCATFIRIFISHHCETYFQSALDLDSSSRPFDALAQVRAQERRQMVPESAIKNKKVKRFLFFSQECTNNNAWRLRPRGENKTATFFCTLEWTF